MVRELCVELKRRSERGGRERRRSGGEMVGEHGWGGHGVRGRGRGRRRESDGEGFCIDPSDGFSGTGNLSGLGGDTICWTMTVSMEEQEGTEMEMETEGRERAAVGVDDEMRTHVEQLQGKGTV
jgi:hypothetical protein